MEKPGMKKGWTTTKLITAGSIGILIFIFSLPGGVLNVVTGIPGAGGFINIVAQTSLTSLAILLLRQIGTASIVWLVFTIIALPFPLIGPPGLLLKVLIGLFIGIVSDGAFVLTRKSEKLMALMIGGFNQVANFFAFLLMATSGIKWLGGVEKMLKSWFVFPKIILLFVPTFIIGMGLGYLGWFIYLKIKDTAVVKRIQQ